MTERVGWHPSDATEVVSGDRAASLVVECIDSGRLDLRFEHSSDRSLSITTNGRRAMLIMWGRAGHDEGVAAVDPAAGDGAQDGYVLANGQSDRYPDAETVPLANAIEAVRHIIDNDEPDPRLNWRSWR